MRRAFIAVVAFLLLACPRISDARQGTVVSPPLQTETDKKLAEIMDGNTGATKIADIIPALEQFIRENPDYPRLSLAYSNLMGFALMSWSSVRDPGKIMAFADEAMAKYPKDQNLQRSALSVKIRALKAQKNDAAVKVLALKALETETDPRQLQNFAEADPDDAVKLLEKAIAERKKSPAGTPRLGDLTWSYAQSVIRDGRKDEGLRLSQEAVDQTVKEFAEMQVPKDDPILERLSSRYEALANLYADVGSYDKALECATLAERNGNSLEGTAQYDNVRAAIYAKMGKPDLQLEAYAAAYAASMDPATRDKIREAAAKSGKKPEEVFARARAIRNQNAQAFKAFELKTMDGETIALDSLKSKAILVNFFFPT